MGSWSIEPHLPVSGLLSAGPHSGTTFDIIGSVGVAILVLVGATVLMDHLPRLRRLAKPVIATIHRKSLCRSAGSTSPTGWNPPS